MSVTKLTCKNINMKTIVVFVAILVALCSSTVIPSDKSHDVMGESPYIRMPDAEGTPVQVDLDEPVDEELLKTRNGANNQYMLYTRRNPTFPQVIVHGNLNSVLGSNYNANLPLHVFVHGWSGEELSASLYPSITSTILLVQDCNVIFVDWRALADANYVTAVVGVPSVGEHLGNFLIWLSNTSGGNWNHIHLIGFGMGAHIVGNAGRQTGGRPARITGLDPAGPLWHSNPNRLNRNNGQYVEVIHTDGMALGIMDPSGDADFYPYGGRHPQPGCLTNLCSHNRATELFHATLRYNHIFGRECVDLLQAVQGRCDGAEFPMGNGNVNKRGNGLYGLGTGSSWPF